MRIVLFALSSWLVASATVHRGGGLECSEQGGAPVQLNSRARTWLRAPATVTAGAGVTAKSEWVATPPALQWNVSFDQPGRRTARTIAIELPVLARGMRVFTPSERGVMELDRYPDYTPAPYGHISWSDGKAWVLPLVSVMDPATDRALTIALPPDQNIPHLQVEWNDARVLRLVLRHRGVGGGRESSLRILLLEHPADYRSALKAYSGLYPAYFQPVVRRSEGEGAFYYHHIQDHPPFDEMARQNIRYLWSSFWFTHLGEYLPLEAEWAPYTFAKQWKLGEMMSDSRIRAFLSEMRSRGIDTYAYFNVTEYGGSGGRSGGTAEAARALRERFSNALMRNEKGADIPTWEGAMAMNPSSRYSLWPFLEEQVRRHLSRLPEIAGFVIDRLDWASRPDYAHDDGLSMDGDRPFENTALPVAEAVQSVCRLAHAEGKRVFVNQFYRVEVLRDTDGVCHENDYLPALGYLIPLRPASAWHLREKYQGDLLRFEAQMKRRLQWALFPQMIARRFPISQQEAGERAAALQEIYAPLFEPLIGKRQVLEPHPVEATGANDANLFLNGAGHFVVPVTSRIRFLSRNSTGSESVLVRVRVSGVEWAQVRSAGAPACRVPVRATRQGVEVRLPDHRTASVIVLGRGAEPFLPPPVSISFTGAEAPTDPGGRAGLEITGEHAGLPGSLDVLLNGKLVGRLDAPHGVFAVQGPLPSDPQVELRAGDEGTWFVPSRITLRTASGARVAEWRAQDPCGRDTYRLKAEGANSNRADKENRQRADRRARGAEAAVSTSGSPDGWPVISPTSALIRGPLT